MASRQIFRRRLSPATIRFPRGFRSGSYFLDSSRLQRVPRTPVGPCEISTSGSEPEVTSTGVSKAPEMQEASIDPDQVSKIRENLLSRLIDMSSPTLSERLEKLESSLVNYDMRLERTEHTLLERIQQLERTSSEITGSFEKIEEKHDRIFTRLDQHAVKLWGVRDSVEGGTLHGIQAAQKASTDRLGKVESKIEALESGHTDIDQRLKGIVEDKIHEFCTLSELLKSIRCLERDTTGKQLTHDEDTSSDRLELENEIEERPTETGLMDYTSSLESVKETVHCLQGSLALTHRDLMYDMAEVRQRLQKLESTGAPSSGDVYKRINELNRELVLRQEFDKSFEELCAMFFDAMEQSGKNFVLLKTLIDENQARTSFLYRKLGLKTKVPVAGVKE